jgi:hypothetical protein
MKLAAGSMKEKLRNAYKVLFGKLTGKGMFGREL